MDFEVARNAMIDTQVRPNDVTDRRVIGALAATPREVFLPDEAREYAYADRPIACGAGRVVLTARDFAKLLQAAEITPESRVLDIAPGLGYSTAVLARLSNRVVALEADDIRAGALRDRLSRQGVAAELVVGALEKGAPAKAPFDVIMVNGAVERVPDAWMDQLAEGGRCVLILQERGMGRAAVYEKATGVVARRTPFEASAPLLPGFETVAEFRF